MRSIFSTLNRFHHDEQGAPELSTIMIVALIAIPLVIGIILFGQKVAGWFGSAQGELDGQGGNTGGGQPGIPGG
jgi:Flp pilus assembly pilin Flp